LEERISQTETNNREHRGRLEEIGTQHETRNQETKDLEQRLSQVEANHLEHRSKLEEFGAQHEVHNQHRKDLSEHISAHSAAVAAIESRAEMCERRLSELETDRQKHDAKLDEVGAHHDLLKASFEQRISNIENNNREHRGRLVELGTQHEIHSQQTKDLEQQMQVLQKTHAVAGSIVEKQTESFEKRVLQLENGSQEHQHKLDEVGAHHDNLKAMFEERLSQVQNSHQEHGSLLEELGGKHAMQQQHAKTLSEQMLASQTAHDNARSTLDNLREMCERRLSQLETSHEEHSNKLQEASVDHEEHQQHASHLKESVLSIEKACSNACENIEALEKTCQERFGHIEDAAQKHQQRLDELGANHDEQEQHARARSEQVLAVEAACAKANESIDLFVRSTEERVVKLEAGSQEHRDRLDEFGVKHEKQQQHVQTLSDHVLSSTLVDEPLREMCERRLSQLESGSQEHRDKLDSVGASHTELKATFEQRLSDVENNHHEHRSRIEELGRQHDLHQEHVEALSTVCTQTKTVLEQQLEQEMTRGTANDSLTETHQQHDQRISQLESFKQELENRMHELAMHREEHLQRADALSEIMQLFEQATGAAETETRKTNHRLMELENFSQKSQDRLEEIRKELYQLDHSKERQSKSGEQQQEVRTVTGRRKSAVLEARRRSSVLEESEDEQGQEVPKVSDRGLSTAADDEKVPMGHEHRLSQLEGNIQEHRDTLREVRASMSMLEKMCMQRLSRVEKDLQKGQSKIDELSKQKTRSLPEQSPQEDNGGQQPRDKVDEAISMVEDLNQMYEQRISQLDDECRDHQRQAC